MHRNKTFELIMTKYISLDMLEVFFRISIIQNDFFWEW